jgi:hypothetical protein
MPFKICSNCGHEWEGRDQFLSDPGVKIIGYQAHFEQLEIGFLYFNHSCKTTMTFSASEFTDLYAGMIFQDRLTESEQCPGYCLYRGSLEACPAECECAYVREVIQIIKNWEKNPLS